VAENGAVIVDGNIRSLELESWTPSKILSKSDDVSKVRQLWDVRYWRCWAPLYAVPFQKKCELMWVSTFHFFNFLLTFEVTVQSEGIVCQRYIRNKGNDGERKRSRYPISRVIHVFLMIR
jgi:hypothetical protein